MSAPNHDDIVAIEKRMKDAARKLHAMASNVGMSITIIDLHSDRRKDLLARHAVKHLKDGESSAAAETHARADERYDKEFQALMGQYQDAQVTMKEYEIEKISWETARSLLARARETMRTLPGTED